jgi:hypothetical protein
MSAKGSIALLIVAVMVYGCGRTPNKQLGLPQPIEKLTPSANAGQPACDPFQTVLSFYYARANGLDDQARKMLGEKVRQQLENTQSLSLNSLWRDGTTGYHVQPVGTNRFEVEVRSLAVLPKHLTFYRYVETLQVEALTGGHCQITEFVPASTSQTIIEADINQ